MELLQQFYRQQQHNEPISKLPLLLTTVAEATQYRLQQQIQAVLLDCDGVVYRTLDVSPDAASCITSLLQSQPPGSPESSTTPTLMPSPTKLLFVTNNASTNRSELRRKLEKILFSTMSSSSSSSSVTLTDDMMIPTSYAAAQYLRQELILKKQSTSLKNQDGGTNQEHLDLNGTGDTNEPWMVHVIGSPGLCQELKDAGFQVTTVIDEDEPRHSMSRDELADYPFDTAFPYDSSTTNKKKTMAAMVIGLDTKFSYRKLCIANVLLQRHPEALCVATNMDTHDLVGMDGRHLPGNGSIVTCVAYASQRPFIDVGKPSVHLSKIVMSQLNHKDHDDPSVRQGSSIAPSQCLMVGDRLDTDIAFARRSGMKSALVLTGVATAQTVIDIVLKQQQQRQQQGAGKSEDCDESVLPDIILPYLGVLA